MYFFTFTSLFLYFQPSIKYSYFEKGNVKKNEEEVNIVLVMCSSSRMESREDFFSFFLPLKHHAADKQ